MILNIERTVRTKRALKIGERTIWGEEEIQTHKDGLRKRKKRGWFEGANKSHTQGSSEKKINDLEREAKNQLGDECEVKRAKVEKILLHFKSKEEEREDYIREKGDIRN